jgi:hypothetical protein
MELEQRQSAESSNGGDLRVAHKIIEVKTDQLAPSRVYQVMSSRQGHNTAPSSNTGVRGIYCRLQCLP